MKWFRIFSVAAVACAVVAVGIWVAYAVFADGLSEAAATIALASGFLALALGGAAGVAAATSEKKR